ncbi:hypothetical protein PF327_06990 [Sulfurovum sp. XTW-4]|uniref:Uncharacterized protein n=1 Tax=Sulfurovum xiamenensis TaxID=3019066 RepID=A0ABT7QS82_9BACT|nr:hypothetical protein [Sulfurovum xiamenensis]MDM5263941.1 hypothetical protein [Sulfurovum xiamenensis]
MINKLLEQYSLAEKKRLDNPKTYFLLKKSSLARKATFKFTFIFFVLYIATAFLLNGRICYFSIYLVPAFIGAVGVWALIHQKVYKYVFSDELDECRLYVSTIEKFMMKYMGTLLGLITISISVLIFLYFVGVVKISFLPEPCSIKKAVQFNRNYREALEKCIEDIPLETLLPKEEK